MFLNPPGKAPLLGPFLLWRGNDGQNYFGVVKAKDFTLVGGLHISYKGYIVMLCNLLHIQALLLTISAYLFTTPEHLVGQNGKRESSQSAVEQTKLGAGEVEMQRTLVGAQQLSG